ncbi:hypothetical protein [Singulisphaera sp. PoT]|uniref:hypothetical protein n=1 Tax=Singulisphaera sp. PoT TaxID=3411797 RepID=UPI003BF4F0F7
MLDAEVSPAETKPPDTLEARVDRCRNEIRKARGLGISDAEIRGDFIDRAIDHAEECEARGMAPDAVELRLDAALQLFDSLLAEPASN